MPKQSHILEHQLVPITSPNFFEEKDLKAKEQSYFESFQGSFRDGKDSAFPGFKMRVMSKIEVLQLINTFTSIPRIVCGNRFGPSYSGEAVTCFVTVKSNLVGLVTLDSEIIRSRELTPKSAKK